MNKAVMLALVLLLLAVPDSVRANSIFLEAFAWELIPTEQEPYRSNSQNQQATDKFWIRLDRPMDAISDTFSVYFRYDLQVTSQEGAWGYTEFGSWASAVVSVKNPFYYFVDGEQISRGGIDMLSGAPARFGVTNEITLGGYLSAYFSSWWYSFQTYEPVMGNTPVYASVSVTPMYMSYPTAVGETYIDGIPYASPEPGAFLLSASGLGLLLVWGARRRHRDRSVPHGNAPIA
jgi:hypothetical protein